jgi:hypothetical protein
MLFVAIDRTTYLSSYDGRSQPPIVPTVEVVWWSMHEAVSRHHECAGFDDLVEFAAGYLEERQSFGLKHGEVYERLEWPPPWDRASVQLSRGAILLFASELDVKEPGLLRVPALSLPLCSRAPGEACFSDYGLADAQIAYASRAHSLSVGPCSWALTLQVRGDENS